MAVRVRLQGSLIYDAGSLTDRSTPRRQVCVFKVEPGDCTGVIRPRKVHRVCAVIPTTAIARFDAVASKVLWRRCHFHVAVSFGVVQLLDLWNVRWNVQERTGTNTPSGSNATCTANRTHNLWRWQNVEVANHELLQAMIAIVNLFSSFTTQFQRSITRHETRTHAYAHVHTHTPAYSTTHTHAHARTDTRADGIAHCSGPTHPFNPRGAVFPNIVWILRR